MLSEILTALQDGILNLLPFRMVQENEFGVRWSNGRIGKIAQGGLLFKCPIIQSLDILDATYAGFRSPVQCVSSSDSRAVAIRVGLEWRISSPKKFTMVAGENDSDQILAVNVQSATAAVISKESLQQIIARQKPTETAIKNQIAKNVEDYGMEIRRAHIIECVPIFPLRLYQDTETLL